MSEFWNDYVKYFKAGLKGMYPVYLLVISLCVITFYIHIPTIERKNKFFILKSFLSLAGFFVSSFVMNGLISILASDLRYMCTFVLACAWGCFALKGKLTSSIFCVVSGFATQNFIFTFLQLLHSFFNFKMTNFIYITTAIAICTAMYFLCVRRLRNVKKVLVINEVWIATVVLLFVITEMGKARSDNMVTNVTFMLTQIAFDLFIIVYLFLALKSRYKEAEINGIKRAIATNNDIQNESKHYLDFINFKCHDIKQYVNYCCEANMISREVADKILESVSELYQKSYTGNEMIDNVLADKVIICKQRGIKFTHHVSTTDFGAFNESDLATIFNNILYNAIEHVSKITNEQDKIIKLKVFKRNSFLCVSCQNYCLEIPETEDGLPVSTKSEVNHGFGLKSVKYIAEKYSGTIDVKADGQFFVLTVLIPL